jgi:hypothetical protein
VGLFVGFKVYFWKNCLRKITDLLEDEIADC